MPYRQHSDEGEPPRRLQFSLRSLVILMTFCCVALSLLSYASFPPFALHVLVVLAWSGLVVGQGGSALAAASGYRRRGPNEESWLRARRRWAVFLASVAAVGPTITFLLFAVASYCRGSRVDQIDWWLAEIRASAELGSRGVFFSVWLALLCLDSASALLNAMSCAFYFRPRHDFPLLLMRVFGLLSSLIATLAALGFYAEGST